MEGERENLFQHPTHTHITMNTLLDRQIKRNNKRWAESTPKQRRVLIAKDVLQQLKLKKYQARGTYRDFDMLNLVTDDNAQLQPFLLSRNRPTCEVCAKGCLFLSRVRMGNKVTKLAAIRYNPKFANKFWPADNWHLIEYTFEGWVNSAFDVEKITAFVVKYPTKDARLRAICKNIIANNGLFVLP